jgi:hypothetical protein
VKRSGSIAAYPLGSINSANTVRRGENVAWERHG